MYATLRIVEMMATQKVKLSDIIQGLPRFFYTTIQVPCIQALKGKMMRKFLEDAKGKRASTLDGVKIWLDSEDWILMIPDQYGDYLNLTIQAINDEQGERYTQEYMAKIQQWSSL
jgi:mannose-1-phosphate guanylyltransferase/phosphomannomutase